MLNDIDRTLEKLIYEEGNIGRRDVDIAFEQPTGEWAAHIGRPTLNCWCFDIRENLMLRTSGVQVDKNGNRAQKKFPNKRMNVSYLITAWAREVEDEHQMLWRALAALKRFASWSPENCEGTLRYQSRNMPAVIADMTDFPINLVDLWSVLDNQMKLGFLFTLTVEVETDFFMEAPLVLRASVRVGQSEQPPKNRLDVPDDVQIQIPSSKDASEDNASDSDES